MKKRVGKIIIPGDVNIWPHEREIAKVLAIHGYNIEFIRKSNRLREHTSDVLIDGMKWELKSPNANHTRTIYKNLKKAKWQSENVIIDSRRIKRVPDHIILKEVRKRAKEIPEIKRLKYISKSGKVLDIK